MTAYFEGGGSGTKLFIYLEEKANICGLQSSAAVLAGAAKQLDHSASDSSGRSGQLWCLPRHIPLGVLPSETPARTAAAALADGG